MYSGWKRGKPTDEWYENTKEFLDLAFSNPNVVQNGEIKCPCSDCQNYNRKNRDGVELDLCHFGFKRNYTVWTEHGERRVHITNHAFVEVGDMVRMDNMVADLSASEGAIRKSEILAVAKHTTLGQQTLDFLIY